MAVYFALLQPGDTILAMSLADGGHLTHGHKMNFSGRFFNIVPYGVARKRSGSTTTRWSGWPPSTAPLICAGASAYPPHHRLRAAARHRRHRGRLLMVDMAHIAGLVAAGSIPAPSRTRTSSPPPRTRPCAVRAAA
jgi:glycine hydroxymethyltransferase